MHLSKDEIRWHIEVAVWRAVPYRQLWIWWMARGKVVLKPQLIPMTIVKKGVLTNQIAASWLSEKRVDVDQCLVAEEINEGPMHTVMSYYSMAAGDTLRLGPGDLKVHL